MQVLFNSLQETQLTIILTRPNCGYVDTKCSHNAPAKMQGATTNSGARGRLSATCGDYGARKGQQCVESQF
eukprot:2375694-Amphidinium_carterae.1